MPPHCITLRRPCTTILAIAAFSFGLAYAADRGTPPEAQAMLNKALEHYKSVGRKQALGDFSASKAPFRDRDLYVFCVSVEHKIAANGAFPTYVGTSADALVDVNHNPLGKALWDAAAKNREGSIRYAMVNPMTGKVEGKTTFYAKVADDLLCGVGVYNASP